MEALRLEQDRSPEHRQTERGASWYRVHVQTAACNMHRFVTEAWGAAQGLASKREKLGGRAWVKQEVKACGFRGFNHTR